MKSTWLTVHSGGAGRVQFKGAKKSPSEGQDMDDLVVNAVKEVLKENNNVKYMTAHTSGSDKYQENFNSIWEE